MVSVFVYFDDGFAVIAVRMLGVDTQIYGRVGIGFLVWNASTTCSNLIEFVVTAKPDYSD